MYPGAVGVEQDLDLDVARPLEVALEDQPIVAEGGQGLPPGPGERVAQAVGFADHAHALSTTTGRRLDKQGNADTSRRGDEGLVRLVHLVVPGQHRYAELDRESPGRRLVAHRPDRVGRRPDPDQVGAQDRLGERGRLREEAKSRVHGVGTGSNGSGHDRFGVQEIERARAVGRRHHPPHAEPVGGTPDPGRDLAAVRDEECPDGGGRRTVGSRLSAAQSDERVNRVRCDTPATADAPCREPAGRDPALDGASRGTESGRGLPGAQFLGHRGAIVA
jgi:hypothetical protein